MEAAEPRFGVTPPVRHPVPSPAYNRGAFSLNGWAQDTCGRAGGSRLASPLSAAAPAHQRGLSLKPRSGLLGWAATRG